MNAELLRRIIDEASVSELHRAMEMIRHELAGRAVRGDLEAVAHLAGSGSGDLAGAGCHTHAASDQV